MFGYGMESKKKRQISIEICRFFLVERLDPNKNYTCFVWGFALMLDVPKIKG